MGACRFFMRSPHEIKMIVTLSPILEQKRFRELLIMEGAMGVEIESKQVCEISLKVRVNGMRDRQEWCAKTRAMHVIVEL